MRIMILFLAVAIAGQAAEVSERILKTAVGALEDAVAADRIRGAVVLVSKDREILLREAIGFRDKDAGLPMEEDTLFHMASNTKPVVAAAVLMLAEQKLLSLDDRVRKYLPSFDNYRSGEIRIRHLLTHTSGFRIDSLFMMPLAGGRACGLRRLDSAPPARRSNRAQASNTAIPATTLSARLSRSSPASPSPFSSKSAPMSRSA